MPRWSAALQVGHDSLAQSAALLTEGTERREPGGGVAWTWLPGTWDCLLGGALRTVVPPVEKWEARWRGR